MKIEALHRASQNVFNEAFFVFLNNFAKQTYQFALGWWQRSFKERALWNNQLSDHVKAFREGKLQGCRNSQRKPCLLHYSNKWEASKTATQRLKQSVSCWENYLVRRVWRRCVYVSFDIKEDHPSFFLRTSPFGLPIHQRKIICFGCTPCTFEKWSHLKAIQTGKLLLK